MHGAIIFCRVSRVIPCRSASLLLPDGPKAAKRQCPFGKRAQVLLAARKAWGGEGLVGQELGEGNQGASLMGP